MTLAPVTWFRTRTTLGAAFPRKWETVSLVVAISVLTVSKQMQATMYLDNRTRRPRDGLPRGARKTSISKRDRIPLGL